MSGGVEGRRHHRSFGDETFATKQQRAAGLYRIVVEVSAAKLLARLDPGPSSSRPYRDRYCRTDENCVENSSTAARFCLLLKIVI